MERQFRKLWLLLYTCRYEYLLFSVRKLSFHIGKIHVRVLSKELVLVFRRLYVCIFRILFIVLLYGQVFPTYVAFGRSCN